MKRVWFCFWGLMGAACLHNQTGEPPKIYAVTHLPDVELGATQPSTGYSERTVLVDGESRRIAVWLPKETTAPHPLVVYLHGALAPLPNPEGEPRRVTMADQMLTATCLVEALRPLDPLVIIPQSRVGKGGQWWKETESAFVVGLTKAVQRSWHVEPQHTLLMGYSNGGLGTWVLARLYPEHFQAAMPIAFDVGVVGEVTIPTFAIQGTADELFGFEPIASEIARLQAAQQPITFVPRQRGSHFRPCDYASELRGALPWLAEQGFPANKP